MTRSLMRLTAVLAAAGFLAACSQNLASDGTSSPTGGPDRERRPDPEDTVFGEAGISLTGLNDLLGGDDQGGSSLPVNRFLWRASLDTLAFLPLASTDPFTGVIATDWGATPTAPGERVKVTAYLTRPELQASSLRVAVFREVRNVDGIWIPAPVAAETPRQLEDAILTRARQLRIAANDTGTG